MCNYNIIKATSKATYISTSRYTECTYMMAYYKLTKRTNLPHT